MRASFAASILVVACAQIAAVCPDDDPDCQSEAEKVFIRLPCDPERDPHCMICDPTYDPDCNILVKDGPPCNPTDPDCHKTDSSGENTSDSDSGSEGEGNPCPKDDSACEKSSHLVRALKRILTAIKRSRVGTIAQTKTLIAIKSTLPFCVTQEIPTVQR